MASKIEQLAALQQKKDLLHQAQAQLRLDVQAKQTASNQKKLDKTNRDIHLTEERISKLVLGLYTVVTPEPLEQLDETIPILMLPLRLETRFVGNELWVRVFPDEVAIQTHEDTLTEAELKGGMYYWNTLWKNHTKPEFETFKKKTWGQIANHFGANRASWIIKQTRPLKFIIVKQDDFSIISPLDPKPDLEPDPSVKSTKTQAWSKAAKCYVMPDLLKLKLYVGGQGYEISGKPIPQPLPVGLDPTQKMPNKADMDWTGMNIEWLQNFDRAVDMGMGFKVDLTEVKKQIPQYKPEEGFSRLLVMGVRAISLLFPPDILGRNMVNKLFESHRYSNKGLALMRQGTPTNNSEKGRSGFQDSGGFTEERYAQENQQAFNGTSLQNKTDGQLLAEALAIDTELLRTVENSHNTDYNEAVQMNHALYPATLGFYTEHLLHEPSPRAFFGLYNLQELRSFFCSYVTGRGALPVFRVGAQPYGVLPTSNFKEWQWVKLTGGFGPGQLFTKLQETLRDIQTTFQTKINSNVIGHIAQPIPQQPGVNRTNILLDKILSLHPNSETFFQRLCYSKNSIDNNNVPAFNLQLQNIITRIFLLGIPEGVLQLGKIVYGKQAYDLNLKQLIDRETVSETKPITIPNSNEILDSIPKNQNYISWLLNTYIKDKNNILPEYTNGVRESYFKRGDKKEQSPLLYALLKHGLLLELYKCVYYFLKHDSRLPLPENFALFSGGHPTLVSGGDTPETTDDIYTNFIAAKEFFNKIDIHGNKKEDITPMELLEFAQQNFSRDVLNNLVTFPNNFPPIPPNTIDFHTFERFGEYFKALETLEHLPTARLERCLVEHLDCLTYRLDAWQTGMFYQKLEENRKKIGYRSLYVGAFGWLENVKPKMGTKAMNLSNLPPDLVPANGKPVIEADAKGGYIQAPSIGQAKAAALLRNAYLHHHDETAQNPDLMAVNLTSDRVRKALQLFEGMQKGQSIEALLGYQFERSMHEHNLDQYIASFRTTFPLEVQSISEASVIKNASLVANGLAMFKAKKSTSTYPFGKPTAPTGSLPAVLSLKGKDKLAIEAILEELVESVDAMQDLIVAESIYQLTQGNADRAGALLKSIGELKPPPVFEVVKTPRSTAHRVTHRICLLFEAETSLLGSPWNDIALTPRALAESGLNKWLGQMIGDPHNIACTVSHTLSNGTQSTALPVLLSDLAIQPIDLIAIINKTSKSPDSALSKRVAYAYRQKPGVTNSILLDINYEEATTGKISFSEIIPLLWRLKELITNARPLNAGDFDLQSYAGRRNQGNYLTERSDPDMLDDIGYLVQRKNKIIYELNEIKKTLTKALKDYQGNRATIKTELLKLANYGFEESFPTLAINNGVSEEALLNQAKDTLLLLTKKLEPTLFFQDGTIEGDTDFELRVKILLEELKKLIGDSFKILPWFTFNGQESRGEVNRTPAIDLAVKKENTLFDHIKNKTGILDSQRHISNWLKSLTRVRPRIANLEMVNVLYNALQDKDMAWHVTQMPWEAGDAWMALDLPSDLPPPTEKLSVLSNITTAHGTFCGLLIDEWVEEIPDKSETTGITFQHDQPTSQPPQTLLLAISPTDVGKWDWSKLENILKDTFDRAKRRGVSTQDLTTHRWFSLLPGVISEFAPINANVSPDISLFFRDLMEYP